MIGFEGIRTGEGAVRKTVRCWLCGKWAADREQARYDWLAEGDERWFDVDTHRCVKDEQAVIDRRYRAYLIAKHGIKVTYGWISSICDLEEIWTRMVELLATRFNARTVPPAYVALIGAYLAPARRAAATVTTATVTTATVPAAARRRQLAPALATVPAAGHARRRERRGARRDTR